MQTKDERQGNSFVKSGWIELQYARQLRDVARQVGRIIDSHDTSTMAGITRMKGALAQYATIIKPWAVKTGQHIADKLDRQDFSMWRRQSIHISKRLRAMVERDPAGDVIRDFLERQVKYITSLPIEAGERVQALALEARITGRRYDEIKAEIARSGEVTESRSTLIARTECARTGSILTEVRAQAIGATHYIWRTSKDEAVRPSHRAMEGKVCEIGKPPTLSDGTTTAPGQIYNCRCTAQIILPDDL